MPSKFLKISSKLIDSLHLNGNFRLFYHLGRSNFGDDINPWIFHKITGLSCKWGNTSRLHFMGVGSIAGKLTNQSIIAGSGFIEPIKNNKSISPHLILSLRGDLSAEILNTSPTFLGDPVSLINLLLPESSLKKFDLGYIPHVSNYLASKEFAKKYPSVLVINPADSPLKVIDEITSCNRVASQSLHGLIVADAYNIPNIWVEPTKSMIGGAFKFKDYFSTLQSSKESIKESIFFNEFKSLDYSSGTFKYNKKDYLEFLRNSITKLQF